MQGYTIIQNYLQQFIEKKKKLNSDNIMDGIELIQKSKQIEDIQIITIDPSFQRLIYESLKPNTKKKRCSVKQFTLFNNYFQNDLVVIPFHRIEHWSLIIYYKKYNLFLHFDSADIHHSKFHSFVKLCNTHFVNNAISFVFPTSKQLDSWSCGEYLILFYFAFHIFRSNLVDVHMKRDQFIEILKVYIDQIQIIYVNGKPKLF